MYCGCIILFPLEGEERYGQVIDATAERLIIKILFSLPAEIIELKDWMPQYNKNIIPAFGRNSPKNRLQLTKTVIVEKGRVSMRRPSRLEKVIIWFMSGKYKREYNRPLIYPFWRQRFRVTGTLYADGVFVPHGHQWIQEHLYFSQYNTLIAWQTILETR